MNQFYDLLVKKSLGNSRQLEIIRKSSQIKLTWIWIVLGTEDVAELLKDNIKNCHEIVQVRMARFHSLKTLNSVYPKIFFRRLKRATIATNLTSTERPSKFSGRSPWVEFWSHCIRIRPFQIWSHCFRNNVQLLLRCARDRTFFLRLQCLR